MLPRCDGEVMLYILLLIHLNSLLIRSYSGLGRILQKKIFGNNCNSFCRPDAHF